MSARFLARPPVVVGGVVILLVAGGVLAFELHRGVDSTEASASDAPGSVLPDVIASASSGSVALPPPDQARASILQKTTLAQAIEVARPYMENTVARLDVGSALLTLWAAAHLKPSDVGTLAETSPALFQKDPEAERGKRLCFSGIISDIRAEKDLGPRVIDDHAAPLIPVAAPKVALESTPPVSADGGSIAPVLPPPPPTVDYTIPGSGKVFFALVNPKPPPTPDSHSPAPPATLPAPPVENLEVIAVGSTGTLVAGDAARVCGILTGVTLLQDDAGSTTPDVPRYRIVGYFEAPNAAPPSAAPPTPAASSAAPAATPPAHHS